MRASRKSETVAGPAEPDSAGPALSSADFDWFRGQIYDAAGIALQPLKRTMVTSRLARRLRRLGLGGYDEYRAYLQGRNREDPEWREFVNALTTNKTAFFREPQHFELLRRRVLPALRESAEQRAHDTSVSIWSAGCSTGEEPYTLSMVLRQALPPSWRCRITASDIDTAVLKTAERGIYSGHSLEEAPPDVRQRCFLRAPGEDQWAVNPELRALVSFRRINLMEEPWPLEERFDAIFCRNVIIYFDRATQMRLFERFARQLAPGGHLFIGHSESLFGLTEFYERVEGTVYRLRQDVGERIAVAPRAMAPRRVAPHRVAPRPVQAPAVHARVLVGETFASAAPAWVSTVLGSCVSVCLFDPERRIGGMNHFLLPEARGNERRSARYGAGAMEQLIEELIQLGADRGRLVAKVFGAAHSTGSPEVSRGNSVFVRQYLAQAKIPVLAQRLGGASGMELRFETHTGRAFFRYLTSPDDGADLQATGS
jgi:chemotaxis protein methyltransferase CheR